MFYLLLALSLTARADDLRGEVLDLLSAYEEPASPDAIRALGDSADDTLWAIARDSAETTSHRARAITALGHFPDDERRAWLEELLADDAAKSTFRRKAAYALAIGWGGAAVPALSDALADDDVQLRIAAAHALGQIDGDAATAALQARQPSEAEAAVLDAIQSALGGR